MPQVQGTRTAIAVKTSLLIKSRFAFSYFFSQLLQVAYFVKCRQTHRGNRKCVLSQVTILCPNILVIFQLVKEKQNPRKLF